MIMFAEICLNRYSFVCILMKIVITLLQVFTTLLRNQSDICETKTIWISLSLILFVGAGSRIYQIQTEPMSRCKQVGKKEQLLCVAQSPRIVSMAVTLSQVWGFFTVRSKDVRVYFACTKWYFILLEEATTNVLKARPQVMCATFPSNNSQTSFFWSVTVAFIFVRRAQNQFQMVMETSFVLVTNVSTDWNLNPLRVLQQLRDSVMVLESVEIGCFSTNFLLCYKSTSRRQKQTEQASSFLKKLKLLPDENLFNIVPLQSSKYSKKRIVCGQHLIGD